MTRTTTAPQTMPCDQVMGRRPRWRGRRAAGSAVVVTAMSPHFSPVFGAAQRWKDWFQRFVIPACAVSTSWLMGTVYTVPAGTWPLRLVNEAVQPLTGWALLPQAPNPP